MDLKDAFALFGTSASLLLSLTTLYLTQFRRPRIVARLGPEVHLFYDAHASAAVYLPVVFQNRAPVRGFVHKAYLEVRNPKGIYFTMRWLESAKVVWPEPSYEFVSRAKPFKVDGYDSIADVFAFLHPRVPDLTTLDWVEGIYEFTLRVWSKDTPKPDVSRTESLVVTKQAAEALSGHRAASRTNTWYLYFERQGDISLVSGHEPPTYHDGVARY